MNAVLSPASIQASRELLVQTTLLLEAEGYIVLPARSVALGALAEYVDLVADHADGRPRLLVAVCPMSLVEHRWRAIEASPALEAARRHGWCAQLIGWRERGSGWQCKRVGLLLMAADGGLFTNRSEAAA